MKMLVNGVTYHVEIKGEGNEPFVLLHGFTGSTETWQELSEVWMTNFKCILIDLLGHGKTDSPQDDCRYSMENTVRDLDEIVTRLDLKKFSILGYSMGGRVALSYAITFPYKVKKLILESSSPGLKGDVEKKMRKMNDHTLALSIEREGIFRFIESWSELPLFASQKNLPQHVQDQIRNERLRNNITGLANSLRGLGTGVQPSWWDVLETLETPALLLCGEWDEKFCLIAEEMEKKMKNAKKVVIHRSGHAIHVEKPKIFGKIVNEFLL